ncbi:MAG: maltokinase N-terminal cap-like domain-containing protein [Acidimicrobiales bacterium]
MEPRLTERVELPAELVDAIGPYLARQRWYAGEGPPLTTRLVATGRLAELSAGAGQLLWAVVEAEGADYQLVMAERPVVGDRLRGHEEAFIAGFGDRVYYDATVDSEMALELLRVASDGNEHAERARPLGVEQSNTSLVYDDRLILKLFRRLSVGPNPDADVTAALAATGFSHVARPLLRWQRDGRDLAFGQQYLAGGTDGWALALTSLRDYYGAASSRAPVHPALSGGDFAAEVCRLGQMTGEMHLAMAEAFGVSEQGLGDQWRALVSSIEARTRHLVPELADAAEPLLERLRSVRDLGTAVRAHGDYHLGQVMRTDLGWYVLDFEGEPSRSLEERQRHTSVLKDVAGMLRSLYYASQFAVGERAETEPELLQPFAQAWEDRNRSAFVRGYKDCKGTEDLLPPAPEDRGAVRVAYEVDKALYELAYEQAFRPDWARIPRAALQRLLSAPAAELIAGPVEPHEPVGAGDEDREV